MADFNPDNVNPNEEQISALYNIIAEDGDWKTLSPDANPKVDIDRLHPMINPCGSNAALVNAMKGMLGNKNNAMFYRSTKNLVLIDKWWGLEADQKETLRNWIRDNEGCASVKEMSTINIGLSKITCANFIGYLDSPRFRMNQKYLYWKLNLINNANH